MILVVGSTGFLGGEIARRLAARGQSVRALVRRDSDPATVKALLAARMELATGDLKQPPSLAEACRGVDTVISTANAVRSRREGDSIEAVDGQGQAELILAAAGAGVRHFILVSVAGATGAADPLSQAKRNAEQRLQQSGMRYTILRPATFMEVWLSPAVGFDYVTGNVTVYGNGQAPISYISSDDVAEYAVRSVGNASALDQVFELGGPAALAPLDAVRIFEREAGRSFQVTHVPEAALEAQVAQAPDSLARTFAGLMLACARGMEVPAEPARQAFGMHLRTVKQYAGAVLAGLQQQA